MIFFPDPTDPAALRDNWFDRIDLTERQRAALHALSDDELIAALRGAFLAYQDTYYHILDETRAKATDRLLDQLD